MSNLNDDLKIKGDLVIQMFDANGNKYFETEEKNLAVLVGREWIAARLKDTGLPTQMTHMELGQGSTPAAATDTDVGVPFAPRARVALSVAGGTVSSNSVTYTATFGPGVGTGPVSEAIIVNASTGGTILCRTVFGVYNKPAPDTLAISWTVSVLA